MDNIPVVDFDCYGLHVADNKANSDDINKVSHALYDAMSNIGFVYLKNHGIPSQQIENVMNAGMRFFDLPEEVKAKYKRVGTAYHGHNAMETEILYRGFLPDYKESFNISASEIESIKDRERLWPVEHVPELEKLSMDLFKKSQELALRVMDCLAVALKIEDRQFFRKRHNAFSKGSTIALRLLHYPAIPQNYQFKDNQLRCTEHTDYGSVTILYQDDIGGLEVRNRQGDFVHATPIKDTVLVNIGDMMQRWTSDKLQATVHRVRLNEQEPRSYKTRLSIALFCLPDADCVISCLDGTDKYSPMTITEYVEDKLLTSFPPDDKPING